MLRFPALVESMYWFGRGRAVGKARHFVWEFYLQRQPLADGGSTACCQTVACAAFRAIPWGLSASDKVAIGTKNWLGKDQIVYVKQVGVRHSVTRANCFVEAAHDHFAMSL